MRAAVEREALHRWSSPFALAPTGDFWPRRSAIQPPLAACARHWPSNARNDAGFTGLLSTAIFSCRAARRTFGLRSAVIKIAGMLSPKRCRMSRIAATPLPAIEMVIDQQAGDPLARRFDCRNRGFRIGHRDDLGVPRRQQRLHAVQNRRIVFDADDQRAAHGGFRQRGGAGHRRGESDGFCNRDRDRENEPPPTLASSAMPWLSTRASRSTIDNPNPRPRAIRAPCSRR